LGVAVHHAKLPRQFLQAIEGLIASKVLRVVIASPTLAQGLNLSAATVIMNSIHRGEDLIKGEEFANVAGRAGRAFVDIDGQVIYPIFEASAGKRQWKLRAWRELISDAQKRNLVSGILQLLNILFRRLTSKIGSGSAAQMIEYILNNSDWESNIAPLGDDVKSAEQYEEQLRSLDGAILSLVDDLDRDETSIAQALDEALQDSLYKRQLSILRPESQKIFKAILDSRASHIWQRTTSSQRKGFFFAGVGLHAGLAIDESLEELFALLAEGELALAEQQVDIVCDCVEAIAEIMFKIPPFSPSDLPPYWKEVIRGWLRGIAVAELSTHLGVDVNEFVQDAICYRLAWALEAIRVRIAAVNDESGLDGSLTAALEVGSLRIQEMLLVRAGLRSRTIAQLVVEQLQPSFQDFAEMKKWLLSEELRDTAADEAWPTADLAPEWKRFISSNSQPDDIQWSQTSRVYKVKWEHGSAPKSGDRVRLATDIAGITTIYNLELERIGVIKSSKYVRSRGPQISTVGPGADSVLVDTFAPSHS
jgi:hypothetical protein